MARRVLAIGDDHRPRGLGGHTLEAGAQVKPEHVSMGGAEFAGLGIEQRLRHIVNTRALDNRPTERIELNRDTWDTLLCSLESRGSRAYRVDIGPERPVMWLVLGGQSIAVIPVTDLTGDFEANVYGWRREPANPHEPLVSVKLAT